MAAEAPSQHLARDFRKDQWVDKEDHCDRSNSFIGRSVGAYGWERPASSPDSDSLQGITPCASVSEMLNFPQTFDSWNPRVFTSTRFIYALECSFPSVTKLIFT